MPLHTIGHGNRTTDELAGLLSDAGVATLIDVRRHPGSRRNPHLSRQTLEHDLPARGIGYDWRGEELGGRRPVGNPDHSRHRAWHNSSFRAYADYLDTEAARHAVLQLDCDARSSPLAIMCAETLWWRCHRRVIADSLTLVTGLGVIHILDADSTQFHPLHPSVRAGDDGWPVYDVETQLEFPVVETAGEARP